MSKLLLTCIFKDDSEFARVDQMLKSFMPHVDGLCVALTGPSGQFSKLQALITSYSGHYVVCSPQTHPQLYLRDGKRWIFGNFAEARNVCWELARQQAGYDWWLWADADDVLVHGEELRAVADKALANQLDTVFFTYWYALRVNADGTFNEQNVQIDHLRERLIRPGVCQWVSRLHEVCVPAVEHHELRHSLYDYNPQEGRRCVWAHLTDDDRVHQALARNTRILEAQIAEEEGKDPRTLFYLAKTYFDSNNPEYNKKAEELILRYLELSGWREERANAWEYLAHLSIRREDHQLAIERLMRAIEEYPAHHMPYLLLAKEYAELGLLDESHHWLETALRMDPPKARTTIGNPLEIKVLAASLKYNEAARVQDLDGMIQWLTVRNQLVGLDDDGLIATLEDAKRTNEAAKWVFQYAKWLKDHGYTQQVRQLLQALPDELGREPFAAFIANEVTEPKTWGDKTIVYYASWGAEHFERWSGHSVQTGIGGSETAVIRLAEEWVKRGYQVTVYGDPRDEAGVINGVEYRPWYEINWKDTFHVLILWRSPHLLDKDLHARKLYMDLHDVASQLDWTDERMQKVDKVFFKSQYHRDMLPRLPEEKAVILSNGI